MNGEFSEIVSILNMPLSIVSALNEGFILYLIMLFALYTSKYIHFSGRLTGLFFIMYSFSRFFNDFFRKNEISILNHIQKFIPFVSDIPFNLTFGQFFSVVMLIIGILLMLRKHDNSFV